VGNSERTRIFYHKQMRRHASVPARGWLLLGCRRNVTKHLCVCMCVCVQGPSVDAFATGTQRAHGLTFFRNAAVSS
jgi:hypothetical protein